MFCIFWRWFFQWGIPNCTVGSRLHPAKQQQLHPHCLFSGRFVTVAAGSCSPVLGHPLLLCFSEVHPCTASTLQPAVLQLSILIWPSSLLLAPKADVLAEQAVDCQPLTSAQDVAGKLGSSDPTGQIQR